MYILGISAFYHDSAAALIKDGVVIAAIEEERLSRIKHDNGFPIHAINLCLSMEKIEINQIKSVVYYEKPLRKFERILDTFVQTYPKSLKPFLQGIPEWLSEKIKVESIIRKKTGYTGKIQFIPHHCSHASAAFLPSPYPEAAILTIDGVGEYQTTSLWYGKKNKIKLLKSIDFPHSLGLLYSTFTAFLGFKVNEDEYKLMGLGAYGKATYLDEVHQLIECKQDGSFQLNLKYFSFRESYKMWNHHFETIFGKPRKPSEPILKRHKDIAASIQIVAEEVYLNCLNYLSEITHSKNICISGGVALNAVANGKIYTQTPFKHAYVLGAAGDNGAAIGCALYAYHQLQNHPTRSPIKHLTLGNQHHDIEIQSLLRTHKLKFTYFKERQALIAKVAQILAENKIVGWYQGRMEFGPRALGSRSILANPKPIDMKRKVNLIKRREQFRPFAGSILQEKVHEYFVLPEPKLWSPFMTFCFQATNKGKAELAAIIHADNTCRIQTVNQEDNGLYHELISAFYKKTGIACILNTSFNLRGEPIVENPEQAIHDFLITKMDYLVINNYLVSRS